MMTQQMKKMKKKITKKPLPDLTGYDKDVTFDLSDMYEVSDDLDLEFRRQTELVGKAGWFYSRARRKTRLMKARLALMEARLKDHIRFKAKGRMSKDAVDSAMIKRKEYQHALKRYNRAIYRQDLFENILSALDHKKNSLMSLGATQRKELPDELRALSESLRHRMSKRS